jgi:hypothetical protein
VPSPAPGDGIGQALFAAQQQMAVEIWPENWPAFELFARVRTQWNLDRATGSPEEWDELFADVQAMEAAALTAMNES